MNVGRYFLLKDEIEVAAFRLKLELSDLNNERPNDYLKFKSIYDELNSEFNLLNEEFSKPSCTAEGIRFELVRVVSACISKIDNIIKKGYYPSLNQCMVIRGYLFSKIKQALKYTVKYEGGRGPVPEINMSLEYWNYDILLEALSNVKLYLERSRFYSIKDALTCHDKIQDHILIYHKKAIGYNS